MTRTNPVSKSLPDRVGELARVPGVPAELRAVLLDLAFAIERTAEIDAVLARADVPVSQLARSRRRSVKSRLTCLPGGRS